ncbi:MAG: glycoside hydrolase family 2 protein [Anaerolineae bacterium]
MRWSSDRRVAGDCSLVAGDAGRRGVGSGKDGDEGFEIEVTARRLARFVWLALDGTDPPTMLTATSPATSTRGGTRGGRTGVVFGDNCLDLPAGRTVTVRLPALAGWTAECVRASLRVCSLADSFE